jgi:hypothetical protein
MITLLLFYIIVLLHDKMMNLPEEVLFNVMGYIDRNTRLNLLKRIYPARVLRNIVTNITYVDDDDKIKLFEYFKKCVEIIQPILVNYCVNNSGYGRYYALPMSYYDEDDYKLAYISYFREMIKIAISSYPIIYDKMKYKKNRNHLSGCKIIPFLNYKLIMFNKTEPCYSYIKYDLTQEKVEELMIKLILKLTRYMGAKIK